MVTANAGGHGCLDEGLAEVRSRAAVQAAGPNGEIEQTHTEIQGWRRVGQYLGYDGWIAANDGGRADNVERLSDVCIRDLKSFDGWAGIDAVRLRCALSQRI